MNTANYKNGNSKYPVSTDTLDFIQEQIKLIYHLSDIYGQNFILQQQTSATDGIVVVNGEVMPLKKGSLGSYITVYEEYKDITAGGQDFEKVRTMRYAAYTSVNYGANSYLASGFETLQTVSALQAALAEAKKHHPPKGSIQPYYGAVDCDSLPYGWVPCGFYNIPITQGALSYQDEVAKWIARYGAITYERDNTGIGIIRIVSVTIGESDPITIPNLGGRFPVAAGTNYALGETGGAATVKLTAAQSGLPAHSHPLTYNSYRGTSEDGSNRFARAGSNFATYTVQTDAASAQDATAAHENRPPYFAVNMLMKIF